MSIINTSQISSGFWVSLGVIAAFLLIGFILRVF